MSNVRGATTLDISGGPTDGDYYTTTDSNGNFSLYFTCSTGDQIYAYAVGGDTGSGPNSDIGELLVLGPCTTVPTHTLPLVMTEVTTVAAAYAMSGFAVDATDVSSSGTTLAQTGVTNAFANAASLASINTGAAVTFISGSLGFPAWQTVNSLADILAACNESSGASSSACSTLLTTATSNPISGGTAPTDTATAAINIAHYPAYNVATLYGLVASTPPFSGLGAQPNDFTVNIQFGGGGGGCTCSGPGPSEPTGIAIDGQGNVWITNYFFSTSNTFVTELSSSGVNLSGLTGFGSGSGAARGIAIDNSGNAWVAAGSSIVELSGGSVSSTVTSGGLDNAVNVAFDAYGNIWASNKSGSSVSAFNPFLASYFYYGDVQTALSGANGIATDSSGYIWVAANNNVVKLDSSGAVIASTPITSLSSGGGLNAAAIDSGGNVWVPNANTNSVTELSSSDIIISPSGGYTAGGMSTPHSISIDGTGNVWVANTGGSITEFSNAGSLLSGTNGFEPSPYADDEEIAIDPSGNAWVASLVYVLEIIGVATPVVTPLATAVATGTLGTRP